MSDPIDAVAITSDNWVEMKEEYGFEGSEMGYIADNFHIGVVDDERYHLIPSYMFDKNGLFEKYDIDRDVTYLFKKANEQDIPV